MVTLDELVGKEFGFYGVDGNFFKIGRYVFEAIENPDDGYRSYMDEVRAVETDQKLIFFKKPVAKVRVVEADPYEDFDGHRLVDDSGHVWLEFGTDTSDNYYPYCVFQYHPRDPAREEKAKKIAELEEQIRKLKEE